MTNEQRFELLRTAVDAVEIVADTILSMADISPGTVIHIEGGEWDIDKWREAMRVHLKTMLSNLKDN